MTAQTTAEPTDLVSRWGGASHFADLDGPVHWVDFGGPDPDGRASSASSDAPTVVLVHGLGGSHLNWVGIASGLATSSRVVAIDLVGFGLSPARGRSTSVRANADLLGRFVQEIIGGPVVLVGNSMGGMISLLLAGHHPDLVSALVLIDPALPTPKQRPDRQVMTEFLIYSTPVVGEAYLTRAAKKLTDRQRVMATVKICFADSSLADADAIDADVALAGHRRTEPGQEKAFLVAARSLVRVLRSGGRYAAHIRSVKAPVLLIHGESDKLVPVAAARLTASENPAWATEFLEGVGHTPQLERYDLVLARMLPWLTALPRDAA